jgi:hypothetical protein
VSGSQLVLDSNLLVLLAVGSASTGYLGSHKNVKAYSKADFSLLMSFVNDASKFVTTPNILTKTSNLARQFGEPARSRITDILGALIEPMEEIYVDSSSAAKRSEFTRLGLTDAALLDALAPSHTLLTTDYGLYMAALKQGYNAVNFNHLREQHLR